MSSEGWGGKCKSFSTLSAEEIKALPPLPSPAGQIKRDDPRDANYCSFVRAYTEHQMRDYAIAALAKFIGSKEAAQRDATEVRA